MYQFYPLPLPSTYLRPNSNLSPEETYLELEECCRALALLVLHRVVEMDYGLALRRCVSLSVCPSVYPISYNVRYIYIPNMLYKYIL